MSCHKGYIEPVLIGDAAKIQQVSGRFGFDLSGFEIVDSMDRQNILDLGIGMVFSGVVPMASKGQIPTFYAYRSIIREEAKAGSGMNIGFISFWESPDAGSAWV